MIFDSNNLQYNRYTYDVIDKTTGENLKGYYTYIDTDTGEFRRIACDKSGNIVFDPVTGDAEIIEDIDPNLDVRVTPRTD